MIRLRRPTDRLGGCLWLPRFIDKCRLHLAGSLPADFQRPFCSPFGIDGVFLEHFGLTAEEVIAAVAQSSDDAAIVTWLEARSTFTPEKIRSWNALAPQIGRPSFPGEKGFAWARQHLYAACHDPRVDSGFTAIAWDEGFLDEIAPPSPAQ